MYETRIKITAELLNETQAAIITDDTNRFYLTGMRSSAGIVVITKQQAYLLIDFRYYEKAVSVAQGVKVILLEKTFEQLKDIFSAQNIKTVLLEEENTTLSDFNRYRQNLSEYEVLASTELSKTIKNQRAVKSKIEIDYIRQAQNITDKSFEYILGKIKTGISERELMLDLEFYSRRFGSEGVAFDFIVVSGKNTSLPHGVPTEKPIEKGDFVTMDFGAVVNGYRSDMTRTVAVGVVSEEQLKVYNTVLKAQTTALEQIKPQIKCCDIDKTARDIINNAGYEGCFGHGLGHSVGLEIHESPSFNTRDQSLLKEGMVITVEPGIYLENKFGVRIEDMVAVTKNGCDNLTKSSKELIVL